MVEQYPHTILITRKPEPVKGDNGNFSVENSPATILESTCRAEPAGSNPVLKGADGDLVYYSFVVYIPKTAALIQYGDSVVLTKEDGSVFTGFVKQHSNGQLNSRVWV